VYDSVVLTNKQLYELIPDVAPRIIRQSVSHFLGLGLVEVQRTYPKDRFRWVGHKREDSSSVLRTRLEAAVRAAVAAGLVGEEGGQT
jgi:hypothetical protein